MLPPYIRTLSLSGGPFDGKEHVIPRGHYAGDLHLPWMKPCQVPSWEDEMLSPTDTLMRTAVYKVEERRELLKDGVTCRWFYRFQGFVGD